MTYRLEKFKKDGSLISIGDYFAFSVFRFFDTQEAATDYANQLGEDIEYRILKSSNGTAWEELNAALIINIQKLYFSTSEERDAFNAAEAEFAGN